VAETTKLQRLVAETKDPTGDALPGVLRRSATSPKLALFLLLPKRYGRAEEKN
jgi:hypothetical protein